MKGKIPIRQTTMRVDAYRVLAECIERGLAFGWGHAHKHTDRTSQDAIVQAQHDDIMLEIDAYFCLGDEE